MGACQCKQVQLQPGKVHSKKIKEIFHAYLKNQGIKSSKKNAGKDIIDQDIVENVDRHAKAQAKDLIQLMQIDQQFIMKISTVLCERVVDFDQSAELQYLGLALLREVMQTPLNDEEKKKKKNGVKKQFQKLGNNVKKLNLVTKKFIKDESPEPKDGDMNNVMGGKKSKINPNSAIHQTKYQVNLQDLQTQEFVFCVQNEQKILSSVNEVIFYYNYDYDVNPGAIPNNASPRKSVVVRESNQNKHYFAQICLEIVTILVENIQKTQLVENEETYFDIVCNYLFKGDKSNIFAFFDLDPTNPYAQGLEPQHSGDLSKIPFQFNYSYLHNTSQENLKIIVPTDTFSTHIRLLAYSCLFKVIKFMREPYFISQFPQILEHLWCLIMRSKNRIELLGNGNENETIIKKIENEKDEHFEQLLQIGFDLFQYICVKISADSNIDQIDQLNLLINGVFQQFNKQDWSNCKFSVFIFVLMVFNGGKSRIEGNMEFYALLQSYQDRGLQKNIMDESMFDIVVENLFRVLMHDLFEDEKKSEELLIMEDKPKLIVPYQANAKFLNGKINLMKVLFEMLNFVEGKTDSPADWQSENPTYTKIIKDSGIYIQIFTDILKFLAAQEQNDQKQTFLSTVTQLFELYLFKASNDFSILIKSIDFIMSRIQTVNNEMINKKETKNLQTEISYLMNFSQVVLYFIQENLSMILVQSDIDRLPSNIPINVSPGIKNRMSLKAIKRQSIVLYSTLQIPNIYKLKNDYQVYLMQTSQILNQEEEVVHMALGIDLQIKNINATIKTLQKQGIVKKVENQQNFLNHAFQDLFSAFQNKAVLNYRCKRMADDSDMQMLLSQFNDLKHKDYLKIYLYTFMQVILQNQCSNQFLILILDNWLALVAESPQNRPDVGPLHFIAFLTKFAEQMEAKTKQKPDQQLLEMRTKLKALYAFMLAAISPFFHSLNIHLSKYNDLQKCHMAGFLSKPEDIDLLGQKFEAFLSQEIRIIDLVISSYNKLFQDLPKIKQLAQADLDVFQQQISIEIATQEIFSLQSQQVFLLGFQLLKNSDGNAQVNQKADALGSNMKRKADLDQKFNIKTFEQQNHQMSMQKNSSVNLDLLAESMQDSNVHTQQVADISLTMNDDVWKDTDKNNDSKLASSRRPAREDANILNMMESCSSIASSFKGPVGQQNKQQYY